MALTKTQEERLKKLSTVNDFWDSINEDYQRFGSLSPRQKELLEKAKDDHILTVAERAFLEKTAQTNDFFNKMLDGLKRYGTLKPRSYEILLEQIEKSGWEKKAHRVGDTPVRNRHADKSGQAICANSIIDRDAPCLEVATVVVGRMGYCSDHAGEARIDFERWKQRKRQEQEEQRQEPAQGAKKPSPSSSSGYNEDDDEEEDGD